MRVDPDGVFTQTYRLLMFLWNEVSEEDGEAAAAAASLLIAGPPFLPLSLGEFHPSLPDLQTTTAPFTCFRTSGNKVTELRAHGDNGRAGCLHFRLLTGNSLPPPRRATWGAEPVQVKEQICLLAGSPGTTQQTPVFPTA